MILQLKKRGIGKEQQKVNAYFSSYVFKVGELSFGNYVRKDIKCYNGEKVRRRNTIFTAFSVSFSTEQLA